MTVEQNHNFTSPLRYPGGKGALANFAKLVISQNGLLDGDYVEIYAGGAGIAWALLFEEYVSRVHVNDLNSALMAFWRSAIENTEELCRLIQDTNVTMEEWYRQRHTQDNPQQFSQVQLGFSTFFLNRTNRSGILKGGVIGGKQQTGTWKIDARFNKKDLIKRIERISRYSNRIRLYNLDAVVFIEQILPNLPQRTFIYLDPPYFNKGQELYENHYNHEDHAQIAQLVTQQVRQPWLVSYDATDEILQLYMDFPNIQYNINYSAQARYAGSEVIFYRPGLHLPQTDNPTNLKLPILQRPLF